MPLTARQAFKFGFLLKCAEAGLTVAQTQELIEHGITKLSEGMLGNAAAAAKWLSTLGGWGLAAGGVAGAMGGHLLARATEPDADPEEAKIQELISAYKQYASHARRNALNRTYRPTGAPPAPRLM